MNPQNPSREELELRITMLLLGELPAAEAATLRQQIAQDAGLKKLHDELQSTIGLVREVGKNSALADAAALKLSDGRREKLLAHFQTPRPQESFWIRPMKIPALLPMLAVIAIVAVLASMSLTVLSGAKRKTRGMGENFALTSALESSSKEEPAAATPAPAAPAVVTVAPAPALAPPPASIVLPSAEPTVAVGGVSSSYGGEPGVALVNKPFVGANTFYRGLTTTGLPSETKSAMAIDPQTGLPPQANEPADDFKGGHAVTGSLVDSEKGGVYSQNVVGYANVPANSSIDGAAILRDKNAAVGTVNTFADAGSLHDGSGSGRGGVSNWNIQGKVRGYYQDDNSAAGQVAGIAGTSAGAVGLHNGGGVIYESQRLPASTVNGLAGTTFDTQKQQNTALPGSLPLGQFPATPAAEQPEQLAMDKKFDDSEIITKGASQLRSTEPASRSHHEVYKVTPLPGTRAAVPVGEMGDAPLAMSDVPAENRAVTGLGLDQADNTSSAVATRRLDFQGGDRVINEMAFGSAHALADGATAEAFKTGLAKDDANGRYYFVETNSVDAQKSQAEAATLAVNEAVLRQSPQTASDLKSYEAEKRKLADLEEMHKMLNLKITANSIDAKMPTTSMVQIIDPAQPNTKQTFWQGLRGEYASTAKVKVENDGGIIAGFGTPAATAMPYDPYFTQTTFEIMQSQLVLGRVVDSLNLETAWADKNGGQKLTKSEAMERLKSKMSLSPVRNTKLIAISMTSDKPEEAAKLANAVAQAYQEYRVANNQQTARAGLEVLRQQYLDESNQIIQIQSNVDKLVPKPVEPAKPVQPVAEPDAPLRRPSANAPVPQPEVLTSDNAFSTFSLNVSDVSFKLAEASLEKGQMPEAATIRSEEFINAFNYRDPEAAAGQPMAFASERARYPFALNRELLRFSIKTAAAGRPAGRALNLVLLLDNSGSMERADRVAIIREALRVLAGQLHPQDTVSVVTFARTARLWADGIAGDKAGETLDKIGDITPEGGTNLEEAMRLAYETAHRHYLANGMNRVVLLTDGAANLGNVDPAVLKQNVEAQRKQGIALDCFGIGFEGYDDDLLEQLSRNGDGRYAFINSPEEAGTEFAAKLAGALQIAASDVKVQVEFNPQRVIAYRQIGYAKHQLTKEQFRDNTVDAAEIAAQEAGNALYTVQTRPDGAGPVATVHVRYKIPGTTDYQEHSWDVAYDATVPALEQASPAMRLAGAASAFSEWLAVSPFAQEVTPDNLLKLMSGVPEIYGADERPKKLEWMIRQAKSLSGK